MEIIHISRFQYIYSIHLHGVYMIQTLKIKMNRKTYDREVGNFQRLKGRRANKSHAIYAKIIINSVNNLK